MIVAMRRFGPRCRTLNRCGSAYIEKFYVFVFLKNRFLCVCVCVCVCVVVGYDDDMYD